MDENALGVAVSDEQALHVGRHFPVEIRGEFYGPRFYTECSCETRVYADDRETVWNAYIEHLRSVGDGLVGRADRYDDALAALQEHVHPGPLSTTIGSLIRMNLLVGSQRERTLP